MIHRVSEKVIAMWCSMASDVAEDLFRRTTRCDLSLRQAVQCNCLCRVRSGFGPQFQMIQPLYGRETLATKNNETNWAAMLGRHSIFAQADR
jgi:hypothetical protein